MRYGHMINMSSENKHFSKNYKTYNEWLIDNTSNTDYIKRIKRLHNLYPEANLAQLRGHARKAETNLRKQKPIPVSQRSYNSLSPREKLAREKSLGVLKDVRRGKSLTRASRERGISVKKVLALDVFNKNKHKWMARWHDNIPRVMKINENGREVTVVVNDSRISSLIGTYHNIVKKSLNDGDNSGLVPFRHVAFFDAHGRIHRFETNPIALRHIANSREDEEFYDIYAD